MRSIPAVVAVALAMFLPAPGWSQASAGVPASSPADAQARQAAVVADTTWRCSVAIVHSTGSTVDVEFAGLPANQAAANQNFVAIWRNSVIPWTVQPVGRMNVPQDGEQGSVILFDVAVTRVSYTVGYAVGPRTADVCASAGLMPDGSPGPTDAVGMRISGLGSSTVGIHYHTLAGYRPASAGNWIGLWRGMVSPYDLPAPVGQVQIKDDVTEDDVQLDGIGLRPGSTYTLIYFMGPATTTAAVMIRFVAPGPPPNASAAAGTLPYAGFIPATANSVRAERQQRACCPSGWNGKSAALLDDGAGGRFYGSRIR